MKRFLTLTTVLCLIFLPVLADTVEEFPDIETAVFDFDDFLWELDNNLTGTIDEKAENAVFITLFPNYAEEDAFHPNLNCVWSGGLIDVTAMSDSDVQLAAQTVLNGIVTQYKNAGYEARNAFVLQASAMDLEEWGKTVLYTVSSYQIDPAKTGEYTDLYLVQVYVSGTGGTYIFSATASDFETDLVACLDLLDRITWVN